MGKDDLFHKRKAKQAKALSRKVDKRDGYDKVLIVCEGEKTEPNYFQALIRYYKINSANIAIYCDGGSSPINIVDRALHLYQCEEKKSLKFDRVYCVFDKDSHESYDRAVFKVSEMKPDNTFFVCTSIPCFEFWLLLHFEYSRKPYFATEKNSVADMVIKDLKKYIPDYEKNNPDIFNDLVGSLEYAKSNALNILEASTKDLNPNPSTMVHSLVSYLQNIKNIK
jgi:hypothetical protein